MANIFLTRKCNLKCPYCFADEFVNKEDEEITLENFKYALDFIKTDKNERIGFIGGEPLLHPEIGTFLDIVNNDKDIEKVIIYTNGIMIDKYIDKLINEKIFLLINCNSPKDIGKTNFKKLRENLILLKDKKKTHLTLGINMYSDKLDYSYIFDLLELVQRKKVRFSTALPNDSKEHTQNVLESFKEFKPFLFKFFKDCYERGIAPFNDCNSMPDCLFSIEDKRLLLQIEQLGKKSDPPGGLMSSNRTCMPVIDILPDLKAVRCFGLSKYLKVDIKEFKDISVLEKYFFNKIDKYAILINECDKCEDCMRKITNKCGICYTYKLNRIEKAKELIKENINNFEEN